MDEVKNIKKACLDSPDEKLWLITKRMPEVKTIFYHLKSLEYADKPNYDLIRCNLKSILGTNESLPQTISLNISSLPL